MHLSVRARLIATYVVLVVAVAGVALFVLERTLSRDLVGALDARLRGQAGAVAAWLRTGGHPERLAPRFGALVDARVTIVGPDGLVQGDSSDADATGRPIGDAPEIAQARTGALGRAERTLAAGGPVEYLVAVPGEDGRGSWSASRSRSPRRSCSARSRCARSRGRSRR
jgi:hypothetical protein